MKALILSGGTGSRFNQITRNFPKQILPVLGKPVLFYGIESLFNAGIREIFIVIGKNGNKIINSVGNGERWNIKIQYIRQNKSLGLAHAVKISQKFLGNDNFIVWLGDTIIQENFKNIINYFEEKKTNALAVLGKTKTPQNCGIAEIKNNKIVRVIEKPKNPKSDLALAGLYIFDKNIFTAIKNIKPSKRGELELTDALQNLINNSYTVIPFITKKLWIDIGNAENFLLANILLSSQGEEKKFGKYFKGEREKNGKRENMFLQGCTLQDKNCL